MALKYSPKNNWYPGDEKFRCVTKSRKRDRLMCQPCGSPGISREQLVKLTSRTKSRGCGDLTKLCSHLDSIKSVSNGRVCAWCGEKAYQVCGLCGNSNGGPGVALHYSVKGKVGGNNCYYNYHNSAYLGMAREDYLMIGHGLKSEWKKPTKNALKLNRDHILNLEKELI